MTNPGGRGFGEALFVSGLTVTELLEDLCGEPICADRIRHQSGIADAQCPLGLEVGAALIRRAVLLCGRHTAKPYLYAESRIACDRLPEKVCAQLGHTDTPIGRALAECSLGFNREPLGEPNGPPTDADAHVIDLIRRAGFKRAYLIVIDRVPVIAVDEWFLPAALDAWDGSEA